MANFKNFEQIEVWQKSRELTNLIYRVTAEGGFSKVFGLKDQIRKASVSIMSNIAEVLQISRMTSGLMSYLRRSNIKGTKFKTPII